MAVPPDNDAQLSKSHGIKRAGRDLCNIAKSPASINQYPGMTQCTPNMQKTKEALGPALKMMQMNSKAPNVKE
jgi:hypothetical protein